MEINVYQFIRNSELLELAFDSLFQDVQHGESGLSDEDKLKILNKNEIRDDIWEYISIRIPLTRHNDLSDNKIESAKGKTICFFLYSKPSELLNITINSRIVAERVARLKLEVEFELSAFTKIHCKLFPAHGFYYEDFMKPFPCKENGKWILDFVRNTGELTKAVR